MKNRNISDYLNNDYMSAALYLAYRACPNLCDGLKNSGRKIVYTIKKDNIKDELKVSALGGKITTDAGYLHGESSIEGAIVTAGQNYTGANNVNFIEPSGNFGTRFSNTASSARYIFAKPAAYFNLIFRPEDDCNLITQEFEGDEIEPRFYVPTVPLLLVNGSSGIGVGFKTDIYARPLKNVISLLKAKLNKGRIMKKWYYPCWNGFIGDITEIDKNKWQVSGIATLSKKKLSITELPIGIELKTYLDILNDARDKGIITSYLDYSDPRTDRFHFEVTLSDEESKKSLEAIFNDLKLTVTLTEILTCLDENNAIQEFNSIEEILDKYIAIKLYYMDLRIKSEVTRLEKELAELDEICRFIDEVLNDTLNLKQKKTDLEKEMAAKKYTLITRLLAMPFNSLTAERVIELQKKRAAKKKELDQMKQETPKSLWLKDLDELEAAV